MPERILQINFSYSLPTEEFKAKATAGADRIAAKSGLRWKIWIYDDERREAGGLYLFEDEASLDAYSEWVTDELALNPAVSNVSVKEFRINKEATAVTRGPI